MATITYTVTVANSGSGNVYYIDGAANPALTFARGNTYVFNLSDNSNSGHPLAVLFMAKAWETLLMLQV